ncbi:hypothetical protein ACU686_18400, partial [Yinghuangia aomiensis]
VALVRCSCRSSPNGMTRLVVGRTGAGRDRHRGAGVRAGQGRAARLGVGPVLAAASVSAVAFVVFAVVELRGDADARPDVLPRPVRSRRGRGDRIRGELRHVRRAVLHRRR